MPRILKTCGDRFWWHRTTGVYEILGSHLRCPPVPYPYRGMLQLPEGGDIERTRVPRKEKPGVKDAGTNPISQWSGARSQHVRPIAVFAKEGTPPVADTASSSNIPKCNRRVTLQRMGAKQLHASPMKGTDHDRIMPARRLSSARTAHSIGTPCRATTFLEWTRASKGTSPWKIKAPGTPVTHHSAETGAQRGGAPPAMDVRLADRPQEPSSNLGQARGWPGSQTRQRQRTHGAQRNCKVVRCGGQRTLKAARGS